MIRRRAFLTTLAVTAVPAAPAAALAAPPAVPVHSCADWGARPPAGLIEVVNRKPQRILIHHSTSPNLDDQSIGRAYEHARWIQNVHMDQNGWVDSGQHFSNSRGGIVVEGRHGSLAALESGTSMVAGAHCPGQNDVAIGIENEGLYMDISPPVTQWESLVAFCAHLCFRYGIPTSEIFGHRDFTVTQCPGDALYALLPRLRSEVTALFR
ncbi:N-acetylmuramoyl-L-alanine amidase [Nocardia sp. NRRL S-836]|nr:N-acetylmuramoyl-L-alanine amidase [Nocardia sp. NRRL S-836]